LCCAEALKKEAPFLFACCVVMPDNNTVESIGIKMNEFVKDASGEKKPWLSATEQVIHMKQQGIRFELLSESEAVTYLEKNNNYFRLRSYRAGFSKVEDGPRVGEYANLDFKMLIDLSIIDMVLRNVLLPMTLDVEHFAKVRLMHRIEEEGENGYAIVKDFIASYDEVDSMGSVVRNRTKEEIRKGASSPYVATLVNKHPDFDYPVWELFEVVTFGTFLYFLKFCAGRFADNQLRDAFYALQSVKSLRNGCAHNNCILNDMSAGTSVHEAQLAVKKELSKITGIGRGQRRTKMSNERLQQVVTTLYMHRILSSEGVYNHRCSELYALVKRMNMHPEYYRGNDQVATAFSFLAKVIEAWFSPMDAEIKLDGRSLTE